jgi:hypothetical protein
MKVIFLFIQVAPNWIAACENVNFIPGRFLNRDIEERQIECAKRMLLIIIEVKLKCDLMILGKG